LEEREGLGYKKSGQSLVKLIFRTNTNILQDRDGRVEKISP
jgi:hypothetical protein